MIHRSYQQVPACRESLHRSLYELRKLAKPKRFCQLTRRWGTGSAAALIPVILRDFTISARVPILILAVIVIMAMIVIMSVRALSRLCDTMMVMVGELRDQLMRVAEDKKSYQQKM